MRSKFENELGLISSSSVGSTGEVFGRQTLDEYLASAKSTAGKPTEKVEEKKEVEHAWGIGFCPFPYIAGAAVGALSVIAFRAYQE